MRSYVISTTYLPGSEFDKAWLYAQVKVDLQKLEGLTEDSSEYSVLVDKIYNQLKNHLQE